MFAAFALLLGVLGSPVDTARVVDSTLEIEPVGVSFRVPPVWLGAPPVRSHIVCGSTAQGTLADRIHVQPAAFPSLQHATGEWEAEYSAVVDSIMPFADLAAHLGSRGWGRGGCFAGLQMRVYVSSVAQRDIADRVRGIGLTTASAFFSPVQVISTDSAGWHIEHVRWNARYFDYGSDANVELYMRSIGSRLVVLVFVHTTLPDGGQVIDRDEMLASFRVR